MGQHPGAPPWLVVLPGQAMHTPAALAPRSGENVFAGQGVHGPWMPVAAEYVPGGQNVQAVSPATAENVPAGQEVQDPALLYWPAAHDSEYVAHAPDVVSPELAGVVPPGQAVQAPTNVSPGVPEYVPTGQFVHWLADTSPVCPE
jgi:hypothetical protein